MPATFNVNAVAAASMTKAAKRWRYGNALARTVNPRVGYPIPYTTVDEDTQEVLYIDHNHFHRVGTEDDSVGSGIPTP